MVKSCGGNNRANQMNPNNNAYWRARGLPSRPRGWKQQSDKSTQQRKAQSTQGKRG